MRNLRDIVVQKAEVLRNNTFIKSVGTIASGVVISQAISFCASPIISRLYSPEAIGEYSTIASSGTIISSVACLGLLMAIMIPKEDKKASSVCTLLLVSIVSISGLITCGSLLFRDHFMLFKSAMPYAEGCIILLLLIVLSNISVIYYSFANRKGKYKQMFWSPIINAASNTICTIVLGYIYSSSLGYATGTLLGYVFEILFLSRIVNPFDFRNFKLFNTIKEFREFPMFQLPANLLSTYSKQLPVQMISRYYGSGSVGIYSMTMKFLDIPIALLATPINRIYFREASKMHSNGEKIGEFTFSIVRKNIKMAIIPVCIMIVFGEPIFTLLLGKEWTLAGKYAEILGIYILVLFCSTCISGGFTIVGKQRYNLLISIMTVVSNLLVFIVGNSLGFSIVEILVIFSAINVLLRMATNGWFICSEGIRVSRYIGFTFLYIIVPSFLSILIKIILASNNIL